MYPITFSNFFIGNRHSHDIQGHAGPRRRVEYHVDNSRKMMFGKNEPELPLAPEHRDKPGA
jgi:hypothetical protein